MKKLSLAAVCALLLLFGSERLSDTQTKNEKSSPERSQTRSKVIAINTNELEALPHDAGKVKFLATSDDTNGEYAVLEVTEMPGWKTSWHRHNNCEETFYVLEGVLTVKIADKTYGMPAGSYISLPRGTPHGQGNFSNNPVRFLTTLTPGGFEQFFKDRIELFKAVKPGDPDFQRKYDEVRKKHSKWMEVLGTWDAQK